MDNVYALKILFVHKSIVDAFLKKFNEAVDKLKPGMPWDPGVALTPLPELERLNIFGSWSRIAKKHGASVVNKRGGSTNNHFSFPPAYICQ